MKCDRCGAFSDADPGHHVSLYKFDLDNVEDTDHIETNDLCPDCLALFRKWLQG